MRPFPSLPPAFCGFQNGDTSAVLSGSPSITTTATAASPVASYTITVAAGTLSAANYSFTFVNGTLTVTKAILTVTANNASKVYGTANPALSPTYSGFVNGDTSAVLTGSPSLTTTATAASPVGSYTITAAAGTLSAVNYSFTFVDGTLGVPKATSVLSVTSSLNPSVYGNSVTLTLTVAGKAEAV